MNSEYQYEMTATRSLIMKAVSLLFLLPVCAHTLECYTPLLRDVIATDASKLRYTLANIGESDPSFITGLPVLNSSHPLTFRLPGFTIASLLLTEKSRSSPLYWITALDFQQGPAGRYCSSSAVTGEMSIEVREGNGYRAIDAPFREGRDKTNSNPTHNLKKLGGTIGNGRVVRFSLQPVTGDGLRIKILSIDPLMSSVANEACMRVEIYGCERVPGVSSAPSVNTGPLHQYNLIQASADTYGNLYTDSSYTGIASDGYQSGGTGLLTDGTVGRDAASRPVEWVGWEREKTTEIEVLFLFKRRHLINQINLYYWEDEVARMGTVRVSDQNNATLPLNNIQVSNVTERLKLLTLSRDRVIGVSYIKLWLGYAAHSDVVLLTEIEMVGEVLGGATNIATGENITTHIRSTTHTTTPMLNSTTSTHTPQTTVTSPPRRTTTQLATTTTTMTQTLITSNTSVHTTSSTHPTYTTEHATYKYNKSTTATYTNTMANSNVSYSEELSTSHSSTTALAEKGCCSEQTVILLTAVGAGLSVCLNLILLLILACCCCYCCRGCKRGKEVQGEGGGGEEEGVYVPMRSVELRSYQNTLDRTDSDSDSKEEGMHSQEYHYYSKIDDSPESKKHNPEKNTYYPFP